MHHPPRLRSGAPICLVVLLLSGCLKWTKYEDQSYDYYGEKNYKVQSTYSTEGKALQNMSDYRQPSAPVSDRNTPPGY